MTAPAPASSTPDAAPGGAPRPAGIRRRGTVALVVFLLVLAGQSAVMVAQPVLAGMFLAGDYDALTTHGDNGDYLGGICVLVLVAAIVAWRLARTPLWVPVLALLLAVGVYFQIHLGWVQTVIVHVPLGIAVLAVDLVLLVRTLGWWRARRRASRTSRPEVLR